MVWPFGRLMIAFLIIYGSIADMTAPHLTLLTNADWHDYELLDSGNLKKLERFGDFRFIRPEPQAMWRPRLGADAWVADGVFRPDKNNPDNNESGGWHLSNSLPDSWQMRYQELRFLARPTPFRHLGFFPEQAEHWNWCAEKIQQFQQQKQATTATAGTQKNLK